MPYGEKKQSSAPWDEYPTEQIPNTAAARARHAEEEASAHQDQQASAQEAEIMRQMEIEYLAAQQMREDAERQLVEERARLQQQKRAIDQAGAQEQQQYQQQRQQLQQNQFGWESGDLPQEPNLAVQAPYAQEEPVQNVLQANQTPLNDAMGLPKFRQREVQDIRARKHAEHAQGAGARVQRDNLDVFGRPRRTGGSSNGTSPAVQPAPFESAAGGMLRRDSDACTEVTDYDRPAGHENRGRPSVDVFGQPVVNRSLAPTGPNVKRDIFGNEVRYTTAPSPVETAPTRGSQDIFGNTRQQAPKVQEHAGGVKQTYDVFGNVVPERSAPPVQPQQDSHRLKFVDPSIPAAVEGYEPEMVPQCMPPHYTEMEHDLLPVVRPMPGPPGSRITFA